MNSQNENRELIESVVETLRQGEVLLAEISDEHFTRKLPVAFNASHFLPMRKWITASLGCLKPIRLGLTPLY